MDFPEIPDREFPEVYKPKFPELYNPTMPASEDFPTFDKKKKGKKDAL